jgi:acyl-CoA thioesterase-1
MKLIRTLQRLEQGKAVTLVALGDSLTSGWLVEKGYVDFIAQWIRESFASADLNLVNRGVPGDTAGGGLARIKKDALVMDPHLIFIQFGLNDANVGIPPTTFSDTLQTMIQTIRGHTQAEILLITSVPLHWSPADNKVMEAFYRVITRCGKTHGVAVAEVHHFWQQQISRGTDFSSLVQADGIHPTVAGHQLMAEAVWAAFK